MMTLIKICCIFTATEDIEEPSGARGSSNQPLARKPAEVDVSIQSEALHQFDYMLTPTPNETTNSNISTFDVQSDSDTVDPLDSHPGILNCVNTCEENTKDKGSTAVQSQKAESAYFTSKQILPFGCAEQKTNCTFEQNSKSLNNEECSYDLFSSSCSENDTTLTNFSPCVSENKSMAVSSYAQSPGGQSRQFSAVTDTDQSNLSPLQSHHHAKRTYHCNSKWHKPADTLLLFSPEKENMYSANLDASNSNDYVTYSSKGSDTVTDTFKWSSQTALFSSECSDASNLEDNTCRNINRKYQTQSLTLGLSEDNFLRDRTNFIIPPPSESSESDLFDSLTFHSHPKAKHV